jgi:hypothetical protein
MYDLLLVDINMLKMGGLEFSAKILEQDINVRIDVDSFVSWYLERMKSCSIIVENNDIESHKMYILRHELGYNWSLLHKTILEVCT